MNPQPIDGGYILLARAILDSEIWLRPADWLKVWIFILMRVGYSDRKLFRRGEDFFTLDYIARECGVTYSTVDHCLRWLKSAGQIATRKTTRGVVIFVEGYAKYQDGDNYKSDTKSDTSSETAAKQQRNRSDTIKEEEKNIRKKETSVVASAPTPAQEAKAFFDNDDTRQEIITKLVTAGASEDFIRAEVRKFCSYWTERNKSGTKQRWELQSTFEVRRRLNTWLKNSSTSFPRSV